MNFCRHLVEERFSVAMKESPGDGLIIAFAACSPKDSFDRKNARDLLNWRLSAPYISKNLVNGLEEYRFSTIYHGSTSKKDIFYPIVDILREEGKKNRRSVTRARHRIESFLDRYERNEFLNEFDEVEPLIYRPVGNEPANSSQPPADQALNSEPDVPSPGGVFEGIRNFAGKLGKTT